MDSNQAHSLYQRVLSVFEKSDNRDYGDSFITGITENLRDLRSAYAKTFSFSILLMAIFELIVRASITKASIGPFEVSDLSIIRIALPVLVAYQYYQLIALEYNANILEVAHRAAMKSLHSDFVSQELVDILQPVVPAAHGPLMFGERTPGFEGRRVVRRLDWIFAAISFLGFLIFEAYAYIIQVLRFEESILLLFAFVLSVFYLFSAWSIPFSYSSGEP